MIHEAGPVKTLARPNLDPDREHRVGDHVADQKPSWGTTDRSGQEIRISGRPGVAAWASRAFQGAEIGSCAAMSLCDRHRFFSLTRVTRRRPPTKIPPSNDPGGTSQDEAIQIRGAGFDVGGDARRRSRAAGSGRRCRPGDHHQGDRSPGGRGQAGQGHRAEVEGGRQADHRRQRQRLLGQLHHPGARPLPDRVPGGVQRQRDQGDDGPRREQGVAELRREQRPRRRRRRKREAQHLPPGRPDHPGPAPGQGVQDRGGRRREGE